MYVALDPRRRLQRNGHAANDTGDLATHDHTLGSDRAGDLALLADDHLGAGHIAFHRAIDLQRALADDLEALADDLEVVADDRLLAGVARWSRPPLLRRHVECTSIGLQWLERLGLGRRVTREHESPRRCDLAVVEIGKAASRRGGIMSTIGDNPWFHMQDAASYCGHRLPYCGGLRPARQVRRNVEQR